MYTVRKEIILEIFVLRLLMACENQPLKVDTVSHLAYLLA